MIRGARVSLRPVRNEDWPQVEIWGQHRDALWGQFQRFQPDHIPHLRTAFQQHGLLQRDSSMFLIETIEKKRVIGFVTYTMLGTPDADMPYPEIGFGVPDVSARGKGYGKEAVGLLVGFLFAGYPTERVAAFADVDNTPAVHILKGLGFQCEGVLRHATFRDGNWHDVAVYAVLRDEWHPAGTAA